MTNINRLVSTGFTHGLALLIGWSAWSAIRRSHGADAVPAVESTGMRKRPATAAKTTDEVLSIIAAAEKDSTEAEVESEKTLRVFRVEFLDLVKNLPVPEDFASALAEEMKLGKGDGKPTAKVAALMYLWMMRNPADLIHWVGDNDEDPKFLALDGQLHQFVTDAIAENRLDVVRAFLIDPIWGGGTRVPLAEALGKAANLSDIAAVQSAIPNQSRHVFATQISWTWPWEAKSKLADFAISQNRPDLMVLFSYRNFGSGGAAWLLDRMKDESLPEDFRENLANADDLRITALSYSKIPIAERFALMRAQRGDRESPPDTLLWDQLANHDVEGMLDGAGDLNFQFRNGVLDASGVLARVEKEIPEIAENSPDAVRKMIFLNLIEENPHDSMTLLDHLDPEDRPKAVLEAARLAFVSVDPNLFLAALSEVPADDPNLRDDRLKAWHSHAAPNFQRYDEGYVDWVRGLPDGVDRDMALYSLAAATAEDHPELAASLKGQLKDEDLKRRLGGAQ